MRTEQMSSSPLLRNSNLKFTYKKMTLIFLLHISSIFAKKEDGLNTTLFENEILDQSQQGNFFGQPRFNSSCDLESLEAANECEARVLNLYQLPRWRLVSVKIIEF